MNTMTSSKLAAKVAILTLVACGPVDTGDGDPSATGGSAGAPVATGGAPSTGGVGMGGALGGAGGDVDPGAGGAPYDPSPKCPGGSYLSGDTHWLYVVDVWGQHSERIPPGEYSCVPVLPKDLCVYRVDGADGDHLADSAWAYPQNPATCD